eukprot:13596650-Alexandrium_andersonii.AAC.1
MTTPPSLRDAWEDAQEFRLATPLIELTEERVQEVVLGGVATARADRAEPSPARGCFGAMAGRERSGMPG